MSIKVGFTGTGTGLTPYQMIAVERQLQELSPIEFHHGDCVGADAVAHDIATSLGIKTIQHPPTNPRARAFTRCDEVRSCKPYLERNHEIVDETDVLLACPRSKNEELRSGTWATVRYARKQGREIRIIYPLEIPL
jgi:hypothetical protein